MRLIFLLPLLFLVGCSSREDTAKKSNLKGEYLFRKEKERFYTVVKPKSQKRQEYPWEKRFMGKHPRITKEFFLCKGNPLNPVVIKKREGKEDVYFRDCSGSEHHGLPLCDGKEFIYPCLIDLLNHVQEKTGKKVVITTGHRCPLHNTYCDNEPSNFGSKHMMGAEVDFYVEGVEREPQKIIDLLMAYYKNQGKDYENFQRYEKTELVTKPWYNKEIFIKLYRENEGRDFDNQHSHPYISIQVRYDRNTDKKVTFDDTAIRKFLRY